MSAKEEFIQIYRDSIHREGADALLDYLEHKSDFFTVFVIWCVHLIVLHICNRQDNLILLTR